MPDWDWWFSGKEPEPEPEQAESIAEPAIVLERASTPAVPLAPLIIEHKALITRSPKRHASWRIASSAFTIDGIEVPGVFYTVGAVLDMTKRSLYTIRKWEDEGRIPLTEYKSEKGQHMYSEEYIDALHHDLEQRRVLPKSWDVRRGQVPGVYVIKWGNGTRTEESLLKLSSALLLANTSKATWHKYERKLLKLRTPLRWANKRLYSAEMLECVSTAKIHNRRLYGIEEWESFTERLYEGWSAIHVEGAVVESCIRG